MTEQQLKERRAEVGDYYRAKREAEIFWREKCSLEEINLEEEIGDLCSAKDDIESVEDYQNDDDLNHAYGRIEEVIDSLIEQEEADRDDDPPQPLIDLFEQLYAKDREIAELKARLATLDKAFRRHIEKVTEGE